MYRAQSWEAFCICIDSRVNLLLLGYPVTISVSRSASVPVTGPKFNCYFVVTLPGTFHT
jgi:hypothetical protein